MYVKLDEGAFMPTVGYATDAGIDLRSMETTIVPAYSSAVFDTGVHVKLKEGTAGLLVSKSGLNVNRDITSTGLIDAGYTGSIKVKLYNHGENDYMVFAGDKISQLVIIPVVRDDWMEAVDDLGVDSERGDNGFGSTGR